MLALGSWESRLEDGAASRILSRRPVPNQNDTDARDEAEVLGEAALPLLFDSLTTKCTEVRTLEAADVFSAGPGGAPDRGVGAPSILTRRLGLIVGCCMGFVVFIILVSVLGYLKIKKQRVAVKRDQPYPAEYMSYRSFSIQSGDHQTGHPHFLTTVGSTNFVNNT